MPSKARIHLSCQLILSVQIRNTRSDILIRMMQAVARAQMSRYSFEVTLITCVSLVASFLAHAFTALVGCILNILSLFVTVLTLLLLLICEIGGEDGSSANNCTLVGGLYQVIADERAFNKENTINVKVQGFTFKAAGNTGALLVTPGDIEFIDCIFRVSQSV